MQPSTSPATRPVHLRLGFWLGVGTLVVAIAAAGIFGVATHSDSAKTSDLEHYLSDQWSFDDAYATIVQGSNVSFSGGNVSVRSKSETDYTDAQTVCNWVSDWLYDAGNGNEHSEIRILADDESVMSQRRHVNDVCSFG